MGVLSSITDALRAAKAAVVEAGLKSALNSKLRPYGTMTKLELDSKAKTIRLELDLEGEPNPILVEIGSYKLEQQPGKAILTLDKITTSRKWLTTLANEHLAKKPLPVPASLAIAL
jgi:hypothetical protein